MVREIFSVGKGVGMRNGKAYHFDANTVIYQTIGYFFASPITHVIDESMSFEVKDNDSLPPCKEDNALDTEKFSKWMPVDGIPQVFITGMKEFD